MTLKEAKAPDTREHIATMLEAMAKDVRASESEPRSLFVYVQLSDGNTAMGRHVVPGFNPLQQISTFEVDKAALIQQVLGGAIQADAQGAGVVQ